MIRFFQGIKRAADWFNVNPDGLSFVTERRLKDLEASVRRLPESSRTIMDWSSFECIYESLTHDLGEMNVNINSILRRLDNKQEPNPTQLTLPVQQVKATKKPKPVKLQAVEEEVKKVKSLFTQAQVKRFFEYRDGELYWKIIPSNKIKKGNKAGSVNSKGYRQVGIGKNVYRYGRIIYLMFHGYLPECVSYIDSNPLNTRIENLREATPSQISCHKKKLSNNTSAFKGVSFHKQVGKYKAAIVKKKKSHHLGYFDTPEEAYKAYCKAAKKLHGEFARVA
jgi:hypothetical protein